MLGSSAMTLARIATAMRQIKSSASQSRGRNGPSGDSVSRRSAPENFIEQTPWRILGRPGLTPAAPRGSGIIRSVVRGATLLEQAARSSSAEVTRKLHWRGPSDFYCRAGYFPNVIEAIARFIRPAGQAAARRGLPSPKTIVPWPCFKVTIPLLPVTVTSPLKTTTP